MARDSKVGVVRNRNRQQWNYAGDIRLCSVVEYTVYIRDDCTPGTDYYSSSSSAGAAVVCSIIGALRYIQPSELVTFRSICVTMNRIFIDASQQRKCLVPRKLYTRLGCRSTSRVALGPTAGTSDTQRCYDMKISSGSGV